jgi:alpha-1,2-mannosyltransferase
LTIFGQRYNMIALRAESSVRLTGTLMTSRDGSGRARLLRTLVTLALAAVTGIFALTAAVALAGSLAVALPLAGVAVLVVGWVGGKRGAIPLDETACSRGLKVLSALATVLALVQLTRLAVFTVDPSRVSYSCIPWSDFERRHSCLTAYFVAAGAADERSVYDGSLYSAPNDSPTRPRNPLTLGPFRVDIYEYPPPFLLLPRALRLVIPDFMHLRMLWFALNGGAILLSMLVVARLLGPAAGTRALLLSPLVWAALPTLSFLQKGNVQGMVIAASILAMALFQTRRWPLGGALLAFATVSKLYPGMLLVYLLARRQWRALLWTAAMGAAFVLMSLLDTGWAQYAAFFGHLPGLLSGEAFPSLRNPAATAINFSIPGLVFKLKLFGVDGMGFGAARVVGWVWTLIAVWVAVAVARRKLGEGDTLLIGMAVLILGALRSPFVPQSYAAFPPLWLLTLLAATYPPTTKTMAWVVAGWLSLGFYWPQDSGIDPRLLALASAVPQAATIVVAALALRHRRGREQAPERVTSEAVGPPLASAVAIAD